jgi:phosphomannomutase
MEASGRANVSELWDRVAGTYPAALADRRDGLRLDWPDRWVHVRASNTEPIVRVIAEAAAGEQARSLAQEVGGLIRGSRTQTDE